MVRKASFLPRQHLLLCEEEVLHGFCCRKRHGVDGGQLLDRRRLDLRDRAEVIPERLAPLRSDARDMVEQGDEVALAAQLAVIGDGETVRLVADALAGCGAAGSRDRSCLP